MSRLIGELGHAALRRRLSRGGLLLDTGAVATRVISDVPEVADALMAAYRDIPVDEADDVPDFRVVIPYTTVWRRWLRRQVTADVGVPAPFVPLPARMAAVMLEMALNWCIATRAHWWLVFHAAVAEKEGRVLVMPGGSGDGKSTLCAALVARGWRLFSDEFGLLDPQTDHIHPNIRPISLKNQSIDVIRDFAGGDRLTAPISGTPKGTIAYFPPSGEVVTRRRETASPWAVAFPKYEPPEKGRDGGTLERLPTAQAFIELTASSVNYELHGETGFTTMAAFVDKRPVYRMRYTNLDEAMTLIAQLEAEVPA